MAHRFNLLLVICTTLLYDCLSQVNDPGTGDYYGLEFSAGARFINTDQLNTSLVNTGFPSVSDIYPGASLNFNGLYDKILIGISLSTGSRTKKNDIISASSGTTGVGLYGGYRLLKDKNLSFIPLAGVSYNTFRLSINDVLNDMDFDTFINSAPVSKGIHNATLSLLVGQKLLYDIKQLGKDKLGAIFNLWYSVPFKKTNWAFIEAELTNGPEVNPGGLLIELGIIYLIGVEH